MVKRWLGYGRGERRYIVVRTHALHSVKFIFPRIRTHSLFISSVESGRRYAPLVCRLHVNALSIYLCYICGCHFRFSLSLSSRLCQMRQFSTFWQNNRICVHGFSIFQCIYNPTHWTLLLTATSNSYTADRFISSGVYHSIGKALNQKWNWSVFIFSGHFIFICLPDWRMYLLPDILLWRDALTPCRGGAE